MASRDRLDLNHLGRSSSHGVSEKRGQAFAEAAGVCLESQGHAQGAELRVSGDVDRAYQVVWQPSTIQALRSWSDDQEATEYGASGIAILLIERETPFGG